MLEINKIHQGDCLELMKNIPNKSINLILCDLPYGVTQNKEDVKLNLDLLWKEYKRIIKDNGVIALTSQFPFTIDLINSNRSWFKYDLIWNKLLSSGFLNANRMPLRIHEQILIFYKKLGIYNPQKVMGNKNHSKGKVKKNKNRNYGEFGFKDNKELLGNLKHPTSIITIQKTHPSKALHRTEKPVELADWIIKTYTNESDLVLDNCIGSGWTAVSCKKNNRNFIGIDLNKNFVEVSKKRIQEIQMPLDVKKEGGNGIPPTNKFGDE